MRVTHLAILAVLVAAGCSNRDITLHDLNNRTGQPEEFSIVPGKPLQEPDSYADLPNPTPGGANRTDQTPLQDAVAVLGGDPNRVVASGPGVGAGDQAIVSRASRFGRNPGVREQLAEEDLELRRKGSLFTWKLFPEDEYNKAYRRQRLNPHLWVNRYRQAGVQTPTAPPTR